MQIKVVLCVSSCHGYAERRIMKHRTEVKTMLAIDEPPKGLYSSFVGCGVLGQQPRTGKGIQSHSSNYTGR